MFNQYAGWLTDGFWDFLAPIVDPTGYGPVDQDMVAFLLGDGQ